ncbi:unnamed protein product [Penicillium camemberti]|uniref:Str. FM013 n=1 Tax=Penicillium camemberti (strain FM 013) TaxID=1429867 RepID=A0A0G4PMP3_PENC3|nr:unnamed protein product [Penicillium camemberti]
MSRTSPSFDEAPFDLTGVVNKITFITRLLALSIESFSTSTLEATKLKSTLVWRTFNLVVG